MSEEHDVKCVTSEITNESETDLCTVVPENEPCANSVGAIDCQNDIGAKKGTLSWTEEGSQFRVSWNLLEGTATDKDYVALCLKGKF
ncbi:unnamed protein product [Pieris macdunnoughi]|uniref:Uncharacterized protein n=1 Tax=Pieris macdunnoughi TaxID=345717 RepID=A0A821YDQ0_9NEOP|nr:unnamed protein product [Pieris macdunnoughi]